MQAIPSNLSYVASFIHLSFSNNCLTHLTTHFGPHSIDSTIAQEITVKAERSGTKSSREMAIENPQRAHWTLIIVDQHRLSLLARSIRSAYRRRIRRDYCIADRNAAYRNRGMWVTVMCRRRPAGAASRRGSTTGPTCGIVHGESARIRKKSTTRRSGRNWAPRRNGAPSIPANSARGSNSFLLLLLLLLPPLICDHRRRHRTRSSKLRPPTPLLYDVIAGCCHRARGCSEMRSRRARVIPIKTWSGFRHIYDTPRETIFNVGKSSHVTKINVISRRRSAEIFD